MTLDWGLRAEDGRRPSIADKATVDWAVLKMRWQSRDSVIRVRERAFPSTRAHDRVPSGPSSSRQPQDDGKASEIGPRHGIIIIEGPRSACGGMRRAE